VTGCVFQGYSGGILYFVKLHLSVGGVLTIWTNCAINDLGRLRGLQALRDMDEQRNETNGATCILRGELRNRKPSKCSASTPPCAGEAAFLLGIGK
jgi:hypothetical protein